MILTIGSEVRDNKGNTYILDETIGSGGFGYVFKAHCQQDDSIVAVKVLQNAFNNDEMYLTFQKEANQAKLLDSDNVIKYLFIHDGKEFPEFPPYIIMEYTNGGTLRNLIEQQNGKQFEIKTLKDAFMQLAQGMKCISEKLVHRDIKPENILNFNGVLKITDFGLSKISGESTKTLTFKNYGTAMYVAPEAWNNDNNTIQMDIYSMGIVFYELATLSYPYDLPAQRDNINLRDMHLYNSIINPATKNRELPPSIVTMIIKMLEKPTQKRYTNWDEIINVLKTDPLPKDDVSEIVNRAVAIRNEKDLQRQQQQTAQKKAEKERNNYLKFSYAQYRNTIVASLKEFAERFNSQYSQEKRVIIQETEAHYVSGFSTVIKTPSGNDIIISGDVIFKEDFARTMQSQYGEGSRIVYCLPQCKKRDIILWCQVADKNNLGFNLLLLKNDSSIYGDWYILENSVNVFTRINRPSPFGFKLSELPDEINNLGAMHIYNMDLMPFSEDKLLRFVAERV